MIFAITILGDVEYFVALDEYAKDVRDALEKEENEEGFSELLKSGKIKPVSSAVRENDRFSINMSNPTSSGLHF